LPGSIESVVEFGGRPIGQQGEASGEGEPPIGTFVLFVKIPARIQRVHSNRFDLHRVERNLIGAGHAARGEKREALDPVRVQHRVFESAHSGSAAADDAGPPLNPQRFGQFL